MQENDREDDSQRSMILVPSLSSFAEIRDFQHPCPVAALGKIPDESRFASTPRPERFLEITDFLPRESHIPFLVLYVMQIGNDPAGGQGSSAQ